MKLKSKNIVGKKVDCSNRNCVFDNINAWLIWYPGNNDRVVLMNEMREKMGKSKLSFNQLLWRKIEANTE